MGICGALMAGAARLAQELGYTVSGSDAAFYPPMDQQVRALGVPLFAGDEAAAAAKRVDCYVVGNAVSRGNPLMEKILRERLPYISAAQWVGETVLRGRTVLAVAGTHGKTTTASLLAWILTRAGLSPGFLLGGISPNFGVSALLGQSPFFVIEADEYDTAFFDKRPKFMHYSPTAALLSNLEFDHADIYDSIGDIMRQFHYLLRLLPPDGVVVVPAGDDKIAATLQMGVYCPTQTFGDGGLWQWRRYDDNMAIVYDGKEMCRFVPPLAGAANRDNILAAAAMASFAGVKAELIGDYLLDFQPPLRRLQTIANIDGMVLVDDFAHHPTAYRVSLQALAERYPARRLLAIFEPRSNTMKAGVLASDLAPSLAAADRIIAVGTQPWLTEALSPLGGKAQVCENTEAALTALRQEVHDNDCVLFMSNGDFDGLPQKLAAALGK